MTIDRKEELLCNVLRWADQEAKESVKWHELKGIPVKRLEDFRAGFIDGYNRAFAALKLHGKINFD